MKYTYKSSINTDLVGVILVFLVLLIICSYYDILTSMYIFLLVSIPAITIWFMTANKEFSWKSFIPPVLFGSISAIIICLIKGLFIFSTHLYTEYLPDTIIYLFIRDSLLPISLLSAFFLFISKDEWEYKTIALFPLVASFHAVFTPYMTIAGSENNAAFMLFIKPLLIICLCASCGTLSNKIHSYICKKQTPFVAIFSLCLIINLIVPAVIETLWYLKKEMPLCIILSVLYVASNFFLLFIKSIEEK